jgi:hypothetical protein
MIHISSKLASIAVLLLIVSASLAVGCGSSGSAGGAGGAVGSGGARAVDGGAGGGVGGSSDAGADRNPDSGGAAGGTGGGTGSRDAGGSGDTAGGNARFIGTWRPTSGNVTFVCAGINMPQTVTANLTAALGTTSDLVLQTNGSCSVRANVAGNLATALAGQTCNLAMGAITAMLTFSKYTFTLSADGLTATETASGNAMVSQGGPTISCTYSETASYQKI